ncbi:DUF928 domain-containing protein [Lyngbya aestuarii]|uniref:DUF928 domain-containing protein n=1 Tax=Lyngbya aestuarii TaxID=118322 RepID=UPI00403DEB48
MNYLKSPQLQKTFGILLALLGICYLEPLPRSDLQLPVQSAVAGVSMVTPHQLRGREASVLLSGSSLLAKTGNYPFPFPLLAQNPPPPPDSGSPSQQRPAAGSYFKPPKLQLDSWGTGQRQGSASRGQYKLLTALVPVVKDTSDEGQRESVFGLTAAERPIFWFYVPEPLTPTRSFEFVLEDKQGNQVYKTSFMRSGDFSGVIGIELPPTVEPLEVGKMYHWEFKLYLNRNLPIAVDGVVQRVALQSAVASKLEQATALQKPDIYAENGIWYDALTSLAELRCQNPEDSQLLAKWTKLLQDVDLAAIAQEPIIQCSDPAK